MLTHSINQRIDKSFITPIDREDIHLLASRLDDVIDLIDGTARRVAMFHINEVREPAQADGARDRARRPTRSRRRCTRSRSRPLVSEQPPRSSGSRRRATRIYHDAVGALFAGKPDPLEVIKWKEVYDTLESAIDQCKGVAPRAGEHLPQERLSAVIVRRRDRRWSRSSSTSSTASTTRRTPSPRSSARAC